MVLTASRPFVTGSEEKLTEPVVAQCFHRSRQLYLIDSKPADSSE